MFAIFDCRGCVITKWFPIGEGLIVSCEEDHKFDEEIELDGEWLDYCEDCNKEILIDKFE